MANFSSNNSSSVRVEAGSPRSADETGAAENRPGHADFDAFVATIAALRAPGGCPWDQAQTHASIAHNMIEETYEAVDAIESGDIVHLREELGDVLLQVVLQSQIASDAGEFTIDDVCADVNAKMIRRHPHVFGSAHAQSASEVLDLWDQIKMTEQSQVMAKAEDGRTGFSEARQNASSSDSSAANADSSVENDAIAPDEIASRVGANTVSAASLLDSVPSSFPALMQAQKISRKAAAAGFEWESLSAVWEKVYEEIAELEEAYAAAPKAANGKIDAAAESVFAEEPTSAKDTPVKGVSDADSTVNPSVQQAVQAVEQEFGDVIFSLVNVARHMGIDAESALRLTCIKFRHRWEYMEQAAREQALQLETMPQPQQEALWIQAKSRDWQS